MTYEIQEVQEILMEMLNEGLDFESADKLGIVSNKLCFMDHKLWWLRQNLSLSS